MALYMQGAGGSATAIKYNAQSRVVTVGSEDSDSKEYEPTQFVVIMDFPGIRVGWISFSPFDDSNLVAVSSLDNGVARYPKRPGDSYKSGFKIDCKLAKSLGGEVKDFMSVSMLVCQAIDTLHDTYLASPERATGKLPVVKIVKTEGVKSEHGVNYKPIFEIISWVKRPADLVAVTVAGNSQAVVETKREEADEFTDDEIPFDKTAKTDATTVEAEF